MVNWWVYQGYRPFDIGTDGYPLPGQVVKYYRETRGATQLTLARKLHRSKNTVRSMQNQGTALDSFSLRLCLSTLYDIPPILLGLHERFHMPEWWVQDGYPAFEAGEDGYPQPGQVVKYYRKLKRNNGRRWTQVDLADALEITDKAVRDMENRNAGLDAITRRRLLSDMLKIPPALLGLSSLEALFPTLEEVKVPEYTQPDIHAYSLALPSYWEKHLKSTAKGDVNALLSKIGRLHDAILYVSGVDRDTMVELLCRYHILVAFIIDDHPLFCTALLHLNKAAILAQSLNEKELYAAVLYRRGNALFLKGDTLAAIQDYATALESAVSEQLRGAVLLKLGQAQAKAAQTQREFTQALKILDKGGDIARKGHFDGDEHFLRLRVERYHLDRASSLLHSPIPSLRFPDSALDDLAYAAGPDITCRSAYNTILQAKAYTEKGLYPIAASLSEEALPLVKAIQSGVNIARIASLYIQFKESSYGNSPDVARLGAKLL